MKKAARPDRPNQHRAEQERHGPADQQADQDLRVGHGEEAGEVVVLGGGHLAELVFAAHGDHGDEAGEQRDGGDHGRADGDALGFGLGGVAHRVEVGQDLPCPLVLLGRHVFRLAGLQFLAVGVAVVAHLADAVGVVGHRPEHVHRDRVAGQRQHADAGHGHAVGDEHGRRAPVAKDREDDRRGNHQQGRHRALVTHGEALDDVRGVARLTGPGQRLDRVVRGVGVVAGHLVQARRPGSRRSGRSAPAACPGRAECRRLNQAAKSAGFPSGKPAFGHRDNP